MGWRPQLTLSRDNRRIFFGRACGEGAFGIYQTLWPLYIAALGATPPQVGFVMGVVGLSRLLTLMPSGILADHFPPRTIMVAGRGLSALGMLLFAVAQSWWELIPFGLVLAAGSMAFPTILATIADGAGDGPDHTRVFTLINTVAPSAGLLLTPAIGGLIADTLNLRAVFVVAAALAVGAALSFSTISPRPIPTEKESNASYRMTLSDRSISSILFFEMSTIFALTVGIALIPNYLQETQHVSTGMIGLFGSIGAVGSITLGLVIHRVPRLEDPFSALMLSAGSVGGALLLLIAGRSLLAFGLAYLLRGGFFVSWTLFEAALSLVAPPRLRSRAYALAEIMSGAGYSLGPFVSGWLYDVRPVLPLYAGLVLTVTILASIPMARRYLLPGTSAAMDRAAATSPELDRRAEHGRASYEPDRD